MTIDLAIFNWLNGLVGTSGFFDWVIIFLARDLPYLLGIAFLFFIFWVNREKAEKIKFFWTPLVAAFIARFGVTELIRFFYHRPRPFLSYEVSHLLLNNSWSFPSGHAAFFFALSIVVYFYNKKWGGWFFVGSAIIGIARVMAGLHYPSDILGGALIGIASGLFTFIVYRGYNKKSLKVNHGNL